MGGVLIEAYEYDPNTFGIARATSNLRLNATQARAVQDCCRAWQRSNLKTHAALLAQLAQP
jgi:hypothetical protein